LKWSLEPADTGTLSGSGNSVQYTPPNRVATPQSVKVKATLEGSSLSAEAEIKLKPLVAFYADPVSGNDTHPGTFAKPLKTLKQALSLSSGDTKTITLMPGIYDGASGETWNYQLPEGVTVAANSAGVVLTGLQTQEALSFKGSGELRYLTFKGFSQILRATTGKQKLTGVGFEGKRGLYWSGDAQATLQDCIFQTSEMALQASYTSRLDLTGGKLADSRINLIVQQLSAVSIKNTEISLGTMDINQSSSLYLENVKHSNVSSYAIYVRAGQPFLSIKGGSFSGSSNQASVIYSVGGNVVVDGASFSGVGTALGATGGSVVIRNSTISNSKSYGMSIGKDASLKMRNTNVSGSASGANASGISVSEGAGSIDLGTASEPGGNTFRYNSTTSLAISGASGVVQAVGNTWMPSEQGSNGAGHYPSKVVTPVGPYGYESGKNFYIKYPYSIQF
jgi:hypothetical protein